MATFTCMCAPIALPREKTMPTQVRTTDVLHQKTNEAVPAHKNDGKITKTRIIHSNTNDNCASSNWHHDWWQINHKTYAKVLKGDNCLEYGYQVQAFVFKLKTE